MKSEWIDEWMDGCIAFPGIFATRRCCFPLPEGCTALTSSMDGVKTTADGIFIIDQAVEADTATVSDAS